MSGDSGLRGRSICMLTDDFLPAATGVGTHVQRISADLVQRGHRVCVITTRRPGEPAREVWRGVTVYRCFTLKAFGFYQALPSRGMIGRIFEDNAVGMVHFHYLSFLLIQGNRVASRLGLPRVYTYHMTADHLTQPWPLRPLRPLVARWIVHYCNRFDLLVAPSLALVDTMKADGIRRPIRYVSNPVVFDSPTTVAPAARPARFMVLYAGRLNPEKNLPLLLRAFKELADEHPDAGLWIAGVGDQRQQLESLCASLGIEDKVAFLGFLGHQDLGRYYAACDVFVLPSLVETQGLVAMEAMRFARPVIVTRAIVSAKELVEHGVNGYIVDPHAPTELGSMLRRLASDPDLGKRLGRAGFQRSLAFSPDACLQALDSVYAEALADARHSPPA
jgi:glycosyltransferase involved in cell wall biosynthesis